MRYVPEDVQLLHPELLLLCRRGQLEVLRGDEARGYYRHQIKPLTSQATPFAKSATMDSKVANFFSRLRTGKSIDQMADIADKINDYMRFYFGGTIGYPEDEPAAANLWCFAFQMGQFSNGQNRYRCILCQTRFKRGNLEKQYQMLHKHLTEDCLCMNEFTSNLLKECTGIGPDDTGSVKKSSDSPVTATETEKQAIKGFEILHKMKRSVETSAFLQMLEKCLDTIISSDDASIIKSEILHGKSLLLDIVIDTNIPNELCGQLRDWFDSIQCSEKCKQRVPSPSPSDETNTDVFLSDEGQYYYPEDVVQDEDMPVDPSSVSRYSQIVMEMVDHEKLRASTTYLSSEQAYDPQLPSILDILDHDIRLQASNSLLISENEQDAQY